MESNKPNGYLEIPMDELVNETGDNISQLTDSAEFLAINMEDVIDESGSGTISRSRTPLSMDQLIVQGRLQDLMRTIDYSKLDGRSQSGFTMLHHAAKENRVEIIEFLVNTGCDINAGDDEEQTPLHKAAMFGNVESMQLLLEKGADVNKVDSSGQTPLQIAIISGGDIEVVSTLLTKADLTIRKNDGQNALHLATRYHKVDSIDLMLNHSQAPEIIAATCNYGYTPLHLAVSLGHLDTVEKLLKDHKPDVYKTTKPGKTLLHYAASTNNSAILPFLLDLQGTVSLVNKCDENLCTPLHDAAMKGHLKQAELLMDRGATFSSAQHGYSPLHYACENGHLSVVKKMLERHPFQMYYVTNNEDTALHVAAQNGHAAIVKFLLDSGVPITHNLQQASFLDIALFNRESQVASEAVKNDRWHECLDLVSPVHPAPMIHLVHALPDVAKMVMDHSITTAPLHPTHPSYWKKFDFKYLLDESKSKPSDLEEAKSCSTDFDELSADKNKRPHGIWQLIWYYIWHIFMISNDDKANTFKVIKAMLEHDRKILLTHPLLLTFLNLKWRNYGRLVLQIRASLLVVIVVLLTILIAISDPPRPPATHVDASGTNNTDVGTENPNDGEEFHVLSNARKGTHVTLAIITLVVNFVYTFVVVLAIIIPIRLRSFSQWMLSLAELSTVTLTDVFIIAYPTQWLTAVVALLCAWFALNLFCRYFDVFGLYTIMFYDLLYSIVKAILVCLYYIIGFGLIMYIVIGEETLYANPVISVYTTFYSVISGFDIGKLEEKETENNLQYPIATYFIVLIMTVVLSVTLMNLLIGISVGSIDDIQKNAVLYQSKLKIDFFLNLDPNIPTSWKNKIISKNYTVRGSKTDISTFASNLWNYICSFFAPQVGGEDAKEKETNEDSVKLDDMSYRIKQMESQIETVLKHQKSLLSELKR